MTKRLLVSVVLAAAAAGIVSGCVGYVPAGPGYGARPEYRNDDRGYRERDREHERDRDRDGMQNRGDRDRDGDGVRNRDDSRPNNPNRY
jgi:hypothetical protein